jgi:hypothetical protein
LAGEREIEREREMWYDMRGKRVRKSKLVKIQSENT